MAVLVGSAPSLFGELVAAPIAPSSGDIGVVVAVEDGVPSEVEAGSLVIGTVEVGAGSVADIPFGKIVVVRATLVAVLLGAGADDAAGVLEAAAETLPPLDAPVVPTAGVDDPVCGDDKIGVDVGTGAGDGAGAGDEAGAVPAPALVPAVVEVSVISGVAGAPAVTPAVAVVDEASSANTAVVFKNTATPRNTATTADRAFTFFLGRKLGGWGGMNTRSLMNRGGGGGGTGDIFMFRLRE